MITKRSASAARRREFALGADSDDGDGPRGQCIAEDIHRTMGDVSAAERKVARAILSPYPAAGLEPAVQLAARAGASGPTVTRYIARLGFASYREFQQALREEMDARRAGPMMAPPQFTADTPAGKMLLDSATSGSTLLARAFNGIGPSEFEATVELLTDRRRRVHAVGGRFSGVLATLLDQHLQLRRLLGPLAEAIHRPVNSRELVRLRRCRMSSDEARTSLWAK